MTVQPFAAYCLVNSSPRPEFAPVMNAVSALATTGTAPTTNVASRKRAKLARAFLSQSFTSAPQENDAVTLPRAGDGDLDRRLCLEAARGAGVRPREGVRGYGEP